MLDFTTSAMFDLSLLCRSVTLSTFAARMKQKGLTIRLVDCIIIAGNMCVHAGMWLVC